MVTVSWELSAAKMSNASFVCVKDTFQHDLSTEIFLVLCVRGSECALRGMWAVCVCDVRPVSGISSTCTEPPRSSASESDPDFKVHILKHRATCAH